MKATELLSRRYYSLISEEMLAGIKEIRDSYRAKPDPLMEVADGFVLGYIYGKRAERAKKKARAKK